MFTLFISILSLCSLILALIPMNQTVHAMSFRPINAANSPNGAVILGGDGFPFTPTSLPKADAGHRFAGACTNDRGCVNLR